METNEKTIVTDTGPIDLNCFVWDDRRLVDILIEENQLDINQAKDVSRFMLKTIESLELQTISPAVIDALLQGKLTEYGITRAQKILIGKSLFRKNGLILSENARTVLKKRYLKKDLIGEILETPEMMFKRVAHHIAAADVGYGADPSQVAETEKRFYKMMTDLRFLPNSPTLMNAGNELGQLAACFVLPVEDSIDGIFNALNNAANIHKSGGGTGFSFSRLRPKNSIVGTTGGIASGPVSFMKIFNTATEQIKQGGTRRGANMGVLRVDHPDIMEFITCKDSDGELNNFNISVGITDRFMEALKSGSEYDLVDPRDNRSVGKLDAAKVYDALVKQAWKTGDPGILFLDRINRDNPTPLIGQIEGTNPCGEQPLLPMEACNLGSINLSKFVVTNGNKPDIDYSALKETVRDTVHFLDNTIDMSKYPLSEIDKMVKGNRKIGLGVMGFADMLFQLKIPYDSEQALEVAEGVMSFIQKESHNASKYLAEKRGAFKNLDQSIFRNRKDRVYRNATTTTIAPTGTLSIIANCSSGIEPVFALSFVRNVMDDEKLHEVNPCFEKIANERSFHTKDLMDSVAQTGSVSHLDEIPEDVRKVFVTAHDISPEWHIRMQAAFQKYTDNAVSKTVNLPRDAPANDVRTIYDLAHELGCKGVTIYRDGTKENQVLTVPNKGDDVKSTAAVIRNRPETLEGFTSRIKTGMGQLYVTVTEHRGKPFEVFATIGKSGRSTTAKTEAIGRLISLALRTGVDVGEIINQLEGIGGEHPVFQEGGMVLSIPDGISRILKKRYGGDEISKKEKDYVDLSGETCPDCGKKISFEEGCQICHFCGFTKCG